MLFFACRYVEYHGSKKLYVLYWKEVRGHNGSPLSTSYFYRVWREVMNAGVVDPETSTFYTCHVRINSARGFAECKTCSQLRADTQAAKTKEQSDCFVRQLHEHHEDVKKDREELARIARLCKIDKRHVGWMVDAVDKQKFGLPTTESQSKVLAKMHRIVQKITGVQLFSNDHLLLFNCLPDVPKGGNMTMTIIAEMFKKDYVRVATDVYINWDGASDNVCYQCIYGLAFLLRCARMAGWPLQRVHVLRLKVCRHACVFVAALYTNVCVVTYAGGTHPQSIGRELWCSLSSLLRAPVWWHHCAGPVVLHRFQKRTFMYVCVCITSIPFHARVALHA